MTDELVIMQEAPAAPVASAVSWAAIFAGAVVAMAVSLIFAVLGAGFAAGSLAAWPNPGRHLTSFSVWTGVWIIVTQWVSAGVGGYLAGRLRTRWQGLHTHEVFFRDTAAGLITWALATLVVAGLGAALAGAGAPDAASATQQASADAIEAARKAGAAFSVFTGVSLLVGAFIASVAAAIGGQERDLHA